MAEISIVKISALPVAEQIGDEDLLALAQDGATKALAYGTIKDDISEELAPDATLSEAGKAADAKAVGDALALKVDVTAVTAEVNRIDSALATKANTDDVTVALATKANADEVAAALALKADTVTVNAELATKADTDTVNAALALKADKTELTAGLAAKQNVLTFDNTPTEDSTNPVTSGGVWESVTELKNDLGAVRDIADAVGVVFPYVVEAGGLDFHAGSKPTVSTYLTDRRAHTSIDMPLILPAGTKITPDPYFRFGVISTADGITYVDSGWQIAEYTLASDLTVYLALASLRSGEPDPLTPETLANSYTITLPNGKTGLLGDVAKLTQDLSDLTNSVNNISDDLSAYKNSVGNPLTQYLNASSWLVNYYWNGSLAATSANGYECIKAEGLKAGTYHFNRMSAPFTWFENVATGEVKRASTDYGLSDITEETEVTIAYDFNLYLTITGSHIYYKVMVTDGDMLESYLTTAGVYSFNLSEAFRTSVKKPIYCGSTREYTTLKSAIEEATKYMDSVVYVDAETFDLVSEFGTEWLENYAEEANCGLFLKNRVHVIFASGAKVVFNYTGNNEYIQRRFSPFNAAENGFTLENAYVESSNCRYSMHDERGSATDEYHNIYKRCIFIHDSTGTSWGSHQAIGGGLGKNGDILIEDCVLSVAGTANTISYHNSLAADAESKIVITGCYLSSTALISNYGTSTKKSRMIVNNCSLGSEPMIQTDSSYADNVEILKWNNTIRS